MIPSRILVVGAGAFGLTAALELARRDHAVTVLERGDVPDPLAASTDVSKVVRMEYGPDEAYMELGERAREGWIDWNARWEREGLEPLYHETGVLMVSRRPMAAGSFEHESYRLLRARGHGPERMDAAIVPRRFPAWKPGAFVDGFYHAKGGYAESGAVVARLRVEAEHAGVEVRTRSPVRDFVERGGRVAGVVDEAGRTHEADAVVVAAGAWSGALVGPDRCVIRATGHPVFHLRPPDPGPFAADLFPVFTADTSRTGYYGFPLDRDGIVKVANHGLGREMGADEPRAVSEHEKGRLRGFLRETFPALAEAEIVYTRLCLYADTQDEDFWIAPDPDRPGLVVAGGGSGHGFKFAPVLGELTADAVEGLSNRLRHKFRWRPDVRLARGREAARCHER